MFSPQGSHVELTVLQLHVHLLNDVLKFSSYITVMYQEPLKIKKPGGKVLPARRADNLAAIY
jgi:hypothetical protein